MIRINQLKLKVDHTDKDMLWKITKTLRIPMDEIKKYEIVKKSIDARKAPVQYVYVVDVKVENEVQVLKRLHDNNVAQAVTKIYAFPETGMEKLQQRPVIVGSGPAGLFCGLMLAEAGYRPILVERGQTAKERKETVDLFWENGVLNPNSNVQFGEGGAGTFSDGKLNTLVKDPAGRSRKVLEVFVGAGAPKEILYWNKPHMGTDVLIGVVEKMRERILNLGGEVHFNTQVTKLHVEQGKVAGVTLTSVNKEDKKEEHFLAADQVVLAIGHSARDTFQMLADMKVPMEQKAFAVGVRIEHPQELINKSQYGEDYPEGLPAATYKLTRKVCDDRGVYSFCMCPGGYVVDASSEEGHLAVNGMSYQARDGKNANSAMIVTVNPEDFGSTDILAGIEFQRTLEKNAFTEGQGKIPLQLLGDFMANRASTKIGTIEPMLKGQYTLANVRKIFPEHLAEALAEGITGCDNIIKGFAAPDALISGVESRTSSPVRILRNSDFENEIKGLYPCGEGAGYAGGIMSAAMDGIKVAEVIAQKYAPFE